MSGWSTHSGTALVMAQDNIDTDQLIPARFMSVPRVQGYGPYLLHDMRRNADGTLDDTFALNRHSAITVLIAGRNFGSGSSREAAVYALVDAGICAVFAPSFGDIFAGNAVNNGLLPGVVDAQAHAALMHSVGDTAQSAHVDLRAGTVQVGDAHVPFDLRETWQAKLINGWDDIDMTLQHAEQIHAFAQARRRALGWCWPSADEPGQRGLSEI